MTRAISLCYLFIIVTALVLMVLVVRRALAVDLFPPLSYLASELGVGRGAQLPKGIIYNGRPFFFYVIGAQEHPNGRYTVELQAR